MENELQSFDIRFPVESVAFSPDGQYILTAGLYEQIKIWDLNGNLLRIFFKRGDKIFNWG